MYCGEEINVIGSRCVDYVTIGVDNVCDEDCNPNNNEQGTKPASLSASRATQCVLTLQMFLWLMFFILFRFGIHRDLVVLLYTE